MTINSLLYQSPFKVLIYMKTNSLQKVIDVIDRISIYYYYI